MKSVRLAMLAVVLFAVTAISSADTVRYLMTVSGVNENNPFQVQSFSWGISNPTTFSGAGGGLQTGRPSISSFNIMKSFDVTDPMLLNACFQGTHIDHLRVKAYRGSSTIPFLDILMEDCAVESHQMSASINNIPACSVSFAFVKIEINGVIMDQSTLATNPTKLNDMIASLIQGSASTAKRSSHRPKVTVH